VNGLDELSEFGADEGPVRRTGPEKRRQLAVDPGLCEPASGVSETLRPGGPSSAQTNAPKPPWRRLPCEDLDAAALGSRSLTPEATGGRGAVRPNGNIDKPL
jgi:hypothetical protein